MKENNKSKRSTFAVMFYLNRSRVNKDGTSPVMCRVSVDGTSTRLTTQTEINPGQWDAKEGRATGRTTEAVKVNKAIDVLTAQIREHYDRLAVGGYISAEMLKNAVKGKCQRAETLLRLFEEHNEEYAKRVGIDRGKGSLSMYRNSRRKLSIYIKEQLEMEDMPLRRLTRSFITDYVTYLRVDKGYAEKTVFMDIIHLKKMSHRAVQEGSIGFDPFGTFQPPKMEMACRHLKEEELGRLLSTPIADERLRFVRDMFAFCTFTGLSYADLKTLTVQHIETDQDGGVWIRKRRCKTGVEFNVKLLPIPRQIMAKYETMRKDARIFDVPSYSVIRNGMKPLGELCGIQYVTFHLARHNFATLITLSNGVPMVTLSKMMGHRTIRTTQIYGKITSRKVGEEMKEVSKELNVKYRTKALCNRYNTV